MDTQQRLKDYYSNTSKHSNYQVLPSALQAILSAEDVQTKTRSEKERLDYILKNVDVANKTVLDIGGNTGYFTFELLDAGAKSINHYEGNREHSEFVRLAADALKVSGRVTTTNKYYQFDDTDAASYDIALLLNVLHHLGDDYGDKSQTIEAAKERIITQLNDMSTHTHTLVYQMGFNWQGNPSTCLFKHGTKLEMIKYITNGIKDYWDVTATGIAVRTAKGIEYVDRNESNLQRDDTLGEFLNRPIFVLKSKRS